MNSNTSISNIIESLSGFLKANNNKIDSIWKNLIELIPIQDNSTQRISYTQVIKYFVSEKPDNLAITKAAILVENHSQEYIVTQVFLDASNNIVCYPDGRPYGRRIVAYDLDDELRDTLGDKNLIIVE